MSHCALVTIALMLGLVGETPQSEKAVAEAGNDAWFRVCQRYAAEYRISRSNASAPFTLLPRPVFRHAQATRGSIDIGGVWLWVDKQGRPAAVGTVFVYPMVNTPYHNMIHEFHSLSDGPVIAYWRKEEKATETSQPGIQWQPIPDAPPPADSAVKQRLQIRELSRRFTAYNVRGESDRWQLRLISAPVYSYGPDDGPPAAKATMPGALFAFCQGTDPEIFLAIELRGDADPRRWHYACAPFSDLELHALLDDVDVWQKAAGLAPPNGPHWGRGLSNLVLAEEERKALPPGSSESRP